jgi:hypothetical protein
MKTPYEEAKVKELRDAFLDSAFQVYGIDLTDEMQAEFVGRNMATLDALFAIRDGEEWRGMTDPQEIARAVLRLGKIGE